MCAEFLDTSFWQNFASNASATLVGVLAGIPIAFWIDRLLARRRAKQEQVKKLGEQQEMKNHLLSLYQETMRKNRDLLVQMQREVTPGQIIFYNVDQSLLEATVSLKYEIIGNLDLNRRLDTLRYELLHLHRKVDLQLEAAYSPFRETGDYRVLYRNLLGAIQVHIPRIVKDIDEILILIDAELRN